jgi:RND family efflux transporter MFP subunit
MSMQSGQHLQFTKRSLIGFALTLMVIIGVRFAHEGDGVDDASAAPARSGQGAASAVVPVPVSAVVQQTVPIYLEYSGTTDAVRHVTLEAQVTGYLMRHAVADGTEVHKGELLYQIDPRSYAATLKEALAQAQRDTAAHRYAAARHARNLGLSRTGEVALDVVEQSANNEQQQSAAQAADEAAIASAALNLRYTSIRAPFAGRLSLTQVHEGALITAGTQLNTLVQLDPIYATFNAPEHDLAQIQQAQSRAPVPVDVMAGHSQAATYHGTLSFLDNSVDRTRGTITMRATIDNFRHTLLPGQFVRVRLHIATQQNALLVPDVAVNSSSLGPYVYVVSRGDRVEPRYVALGPSYGSLVVASGALRAGEYVLVGDLLQAWAGMRVRPVLQPQPRPAAGAFPSAASNRFLSSPAAIARDSVRRPGAVESR